MTATAERIAAGLADGVRPGDRVDVQITSGTSELYLAILGILLVGAAYVPVDADDPPERAELVFGRLPSPQSSPDLTASATSPPRADKQIKLGGRRIELGEVDAALQALPGIAGGAAAVKTTTAGNQILVVTSYPRTAYLLIKPLPEHDCPRRFPPR